MRCVCELCARAACLASTHGELHVGHVHVRSLRRLYEAAKRDPLNAKPVADGVAEYLLPLTSRPAKDILAKAKLLAKL